MYRILIVEDDRGIGEAIVRQASVWGLEAKCVTDFQNVMSQFGAFDPQLVLMDITLPFFNGYHCLFSVPTHPNPGTAPRNG